MPLSPTDIQQMGQLPSAERQKLPLPPGDDGEVWLTTKNTRLEIDGNYVRLKTRGGSTLTHSFFGNILTVYGFQARIGGAIKKYVAVHTAGAKVYLWDIGAGTSDEIISSGMSTTRKVQFFNRGRFLYVFDYDYGAGKVYNIDRDKIFDYMRYGGSRLYSMSTNHEDITTLDENIMGFEIGSPAWVLPTTINRGYDRIGASELEVYSTGNFKVFEYKYNGGVHMTVDAKDYKEDAVFYLLDEKMEYSLSGALAGDATDPTLREVTAMHIDPDSLRPDYRPRKKSVKSFSTGGVGFSFRQTHPYPNNRSVGDNGTITDSEGNTVYSSNFAVPASPDLEEYIEGYDEYVSATLNTSTGYEFPDFYKSYIVVDLLEDGSVAMPTEPSTISVNAENIFNSTGCIASVEMSLESAYFDNVAKRFLCATRWHPEKGDTLTPSSEAYPNSPFFIVKELDPEQTSNIKDYTPDSKLFRPITEVLPMRAGIPIIFGPQEISPKSVTSFGESLLIGGYRINRPVPQVHNTADPVIAGMRWNVRVSVSGSAVASQEIRVFFQYTDGTRSDLSVATDVGSTGGTTITISSINALVSKIYVLGVDTSGTSDAYHLIKEVGPEDPEINGLSFTTATDITTYPSFTLPGADMILETVDLENYVTVGTPPQEIRITEQRRIDGGASINNLIGTRFDSDKTTMRMRVAVLTDQNIQLGYVARRITTSPQTGKTELTFEADFETGFSGMICSSPDGARNVLGRVIIPTKDKVFAWAPGSPPEPIFDSRRYAVSSSNDLDDVLYHPNRHEFWLFYRSTEIVVVDISSGTTRRMAYSGVGDIRAGAFFDDNLYIGADTDLLETDKDGTLTDKSGGDPVAGELTSIHLGDELSQWRLLECTIGGQQFSATLEVDYQGSRFEDDSSVWSDGFSADKSIGPKTLKIHGASYQIHRMAVMPRIRITFNAAASGFLSHAILKYVPTQNIGKARM